MPLEVFTQEELLAINTTYSFSYKQPLKIKQIPLKAKK